MVSLRVSNKKARLKRAFLLALQIAAEYVLGRKRQVVGRPVGAAARHQSAEPKVFLICCDEDAATAYAVIPGNPALRGLLA